MIRCVPVLFKHLGKFCNTQSKVCGTNRFNSCHKMIEIDPSSKKVGTDIALSTRSYHPRGLARKLMILVDILRYSFQNWWHKL